MNGAHIFALSLFALIGAIAAQSGPVNLGTGSNFGILSGSAVNFINPSTPTVVTGDIGATKVIPAAGPSTLNGNMHIKDSTYSSAMSALAFAISDANSRQCSQTFSSVEIGGQTLMPGTYCFSGNAQITGTLALNGPGIYIFKVAGALTTMSNSQVALENGASASQIFWSVGGSASLGTGSSFFGTILGAGAISQGSSSTVIGRLLSQSTIAISGIDTVTNPLGGSSAGGSTTSTVPSTSSTTISSGGTVGGGNAGGGATTTQISAIKATLCDIIGSVRDIIGILALVMFLVGGTLYTIGHFMPAAGQVRASMQGWAVGIMLGGLVGVLLVILAPYIVEVLLGFGTGLSIAC